MKVITLDELNELGEGKVFAETYKDIDKYADLMPTSSLMIRLSDSFEYENDKKIFNGVIDVLPYQSQHNYVGYASGPEVNSWDCASADYNKDDKFIFFEKKDLIVMRDLLDAAIKAYDTGNLDVDIDKLDAILKS